MASDAQPMPPDLQPDVSSAPSGGDRFAQPPRSALARLVPSKLTPWRIVRVLGLAAALALLVVLIVHLGPRKIGGELLAAGPGFLWLLVLHALAVALSALPWHVLLPPAARPRLHQSIASRFVAAGANAVLPIVAFAGDFVRLWWVPEKRDRPAAIAAIIVDRLTYGAANVFTVLAGVLALVHVSSLPPIYLRAALMGAIVLVLVVGIGMVVASRYKMIGRIHRLIRRVRHKHPENHFGDDADLHVERMLREPRGLALAFAGNLGSRIAVSAEIYLAFWLLGIHLDWDELLVFAALPIVVAVAGALVPSQIGVQEGVQALVAASFGIPATTAVAVVLLLRIRSLLGGFVVWFLLAQRTGHPGSLGRV